MAINYTYPAKGSPDGADRFLIVDSEDGDATKLITIDLSLIHI